MFKGLKSRIQDEANKLKENFQVLGETVSSHPSTSSISADLVSLDDTNDEISITCDAKAVESKVAAVEQKLSKEWKARLDQRELEWSQRLAKAQEEVTLKLAECKAQSHQAMEQKDAELCNWIAKFHEATKKLENIQTDMGKKTSTQAAEVKDFENTLKQEKKRLLEEMDELYAQQDVFKRKNAELSQKLEVLKQPGQNESIEVDQKLKEFNDSLQKEVNTLKSEVATLTLTLKQLETVLNEKNVATQTLKQECDAKQLIVDKLNKDLSSLQKENLLKQEESQKQLSAHSASEKHLQTEIIEKDETLMLLKKQIESLSQQLKDKSQALEELTEKTSTENVTEEKFSKAKKLLRDLNDSKKKLEQELEECRLYATILVKNSTETDTEQMTLTDAFRHLDIKLKEHNHQVAEYLAKRENDAQTIYDLNIELQSAKQELSEMKHLQEEAPVEWDRRTDSTKILAENVDYQEKLSELEQARDLLQSNLEKTEAEFKSVKDSIEDFKNKNLKLSELYEQSKKDVKKLEENYQKLKNEQNKMIEEDEQLLQHIQQLVAENTLLKQQLEKQDQNNVDKNKLEIDLVASLNRCMELEHKLETLSAQTKEQKVEVNKLQNQISDILKATDNEKARLSAELLSHSEMLRDQNARFDCLNTEKIKLKEEIQQLMHTNSKNSEENRDLNQQVAELQYKRKELEKDLNELKIDQQEQNKTHSETVLQNVKTECETLKKQLHEITIERDQQNGELEQLQARLDQALLEVEEERKQQKLEIASLDDKLKAEQVKKAELEEKIAILLEDEKRIKLKVSEQDEKFEKLTLQLFDLTQKNTKYSDEKQQNYKEVEQLQQQIESLNNSLVEVKIENTNSSKDKQNVIEELAKENAYFKELVADAKHSQNQLQTNQNQLLIDFETQKSTLVNKVDELKNLQSEHEKISKDATILNEKVVKLEKQLDQSNSNNEQSVIKLEQLQHSFNELVSSNKETVQQNVKLQSQLQSLFLELDDLSRTKEELSRNNEVLVREREEFSRNSIDNNKQFEVIHKQNKELVEEVEQLKQIVDKQAISVEKERSVSENAHQKLQTDNHELHKLISEIKQQNESLKNDVAVYRNEAEVMFSVVAKAQEKNKDLESEKMKLEEELKTLQMRLQETDDADSHGWDTESDLYRDEVETLRLGNEKLSKELEEVKELLAGIRTDGPPFEYVQNIIYKYLMSKDNLGKGAVPLVRVIATATGMNTQQTNDVVNNEEKRVNSISSLRNAVNKLQQH